MSATAGGAQWDDGPGWGEYAKLRERLDALERERRSGMTQEFTFGNRAIVNQGQGSVSCDGVLLVDHGVLTAAGERWVDKPGATGKTKWPPEGWAEWRDAGMPT